ncbi:MAG: hypothetical protein AB7H66_11455 [Hyphomonadaceae bacterium]
MRSLAAAAFLVACGFSAAIAQPVPNTMRSAALTVAQEQELNRRLSLMGAQIANLARRVSLREDAIRNLAIEVYDAQPDLSFESYLDRVENGAGELQRYLASARSERASDAQIQSVRLRAIAAAENGRISEARALYHDLLQQAQARRAARETEQRDDFLAAVEAARLASAQGDIDSALSYFALADDLYGRGFTSLSDNQNAILYDVLTLGRVSLLSMRAIYSQRPEDAQEVLQEVRGNPLFSSPERLAAIDGVTSRGATQLLLIGLLGVAARSGDHEAGDQAEAMIEAGLRSHRDDPVLQGEFHAVRGYLALDRLDHAAAEASLQAALQTLAEDGNTRSWARAQNALGNVYLNRADSGDVGALDSAGPYLENALRVRSSIGDATSLAETEAGMGRYFFLRGEQGDRSAYPDSARHYRRAIELYPQRQGDRMGRLLYYHLGHALHKSGPRSDDEYREVAAAFETALPALTAPDDGNLRGQANTVRGTAYAVLGSRGDLPSLERAVESIESAIEDTPDEARPLSYIMLAAIHMQRRRHGVTQDSTDARAAAEQALLIARRIGNPQFEQLATAALAQIPN